MGISNDIRPKRKLYDHYHSTAKTHEEEEKEEEVEEIPVETEEEKTKEPPRIEEKGEYERIDYLEDEFFSGNGKNYGQKPANPQMPNPHKSHRRLIWILAGILTLIVVLQNISYITNAVKSMFGKEEVSQEEKIPPKEEKEYYMGEISNTEEPTTSPETTPTPSVVPSPTTTPTPSTTPATTDVSSLKIKVLNGNGIAGSADKARDILVAAGYTIDKVSNAARFGYATSIIYYKTGRDSEAQAVKTALSTYTTTVEKSDTIVSTYDIVIVVGKQ